MGNTQIREPKQRRSKEKKEKIIEAGLKLFCEKGYHNTNTAEIAKEACVSTGIVYNYFSDKKDIFIAAVQMYTENITGPMYEKIASLEGNIDLTDLLEELIELFIKSHNISKLAHEEMMAMSHQDEDVRAYFFQFEMNTANTIVQLMAEHGIKPTNPNEKVHIAMGMIENFCHEIVYHRHEHMNYELMKQEVIRAVIQMLAN